MPETKIVSWNVNGIRAIAKKDFFTDLNALNPDIFCLQETKAAENDVKTTLAGLSQYQIFANSSKARKGYSGTAIVTRKEPIDVIQDMGMEEYDQEGRVLALEFTSFFLVTVYVPNSGEELSRLEFRTRWNQEFQNYLRWLDRRKPVVVCGDLNVAHQEIDIARPKENYNKSAGYTQKEIDDFGQLLNSGFTDIYRKQHPAEVKYTYWNYWLNAREKNVGWRIDYFLVSNRLVERVTDSYIYNDRFGSDHCPIGLNLHTDF